MSMHDLLYIIGLILSYSLACMGLHASPLQPQPRMLVQCAFGLVVLFVGMQHFGLFG